MGKWIQKKTHTEKMRGGIARGRPSASAGAVQQGYPERDAVWYIQQCDAFDEVPFIWCWLSWDIVRWCLHENGFRAGKSRVQKWDAFTQTVRKTWQDEPGEWKPGGKAEGFLKKNSTGHIFKDWLGLADTSRFDVVATNNKEIGRSNNIS